MASLLFYTSWGKRSDKDHSKGTCQKNGYQGDWKAETHPKGYQVDWNAEPRPKGYQSDWKAEPRPKGYQGCLW